MAITALDVLTGIRFATNFDKRGYARPQNSAAKHCRRVMEGVIIAHGGVPPSGNVVAFSAVLRRHEADRATLKWLVDQHCGLCSNFRDKTCPGVARAH